MSHRTTYYVGPKAPIWPLGRGVRGLGCGFLVWLLLLLGLGLVAFSLSMVAGLTPFLERHANMIWATVSVLSLAWPALYCWAGWFRTFFGYWPAPEEGRGFGATCATCGSTVRRGRPLEGAFICDTCARQRALDTRRLIVPGVTMIGVTFAANGIASILNLRAHYAGIDASSTVSGYPGISAIDALGTVGSVGLTVSGLIIIYRILRHMVFAPLQPRHLLMARRQIVASLERSQEDTGRP